MQRFPFSLREKQIFQVVYKALSILLYPSISLHPSHWPLQCHLRASQKSQIIFAGGSCLSLKCVYWPVTWQLNHDFEELAHILLLNAFSSVRYEKLQPRPVFYSPLAGLHFLLPEYILKSFAVYFSTLLECKPCKCGYFHLACHKCIPSSKNTVQDTIGMK